MHRPSRSSTLRGGRRAGCWATGSGTERAGAGRVPGDVAGTRGRRTEAALPRGGRLPVSRAPRPPGGSELPTGSMRRRRRDPGDPGSIPRGRARGSQQGAGSAAVGLRREDLRRDQRDIRKRIRRRDRRGMPIGQLIATLRATLR